MGLFRKMGLFSKCSAAGMELFSKRSAAAAAVNTCSFVFSNAAEIASTSASSRKRFIHATGSRYSVKRDYYEILGVSRSATREEIKKAFHGLAKKYHPDANRNNPSTKRKFQEIRDAYETLQDSQKKAQYDMEHTPISENFGYSAKDPEHRHAYGSHFSNSFHKVFSEIFESEAESFARDIQVELLLSFPEAAKGCTKHLSFDSYIPCDSCYGYGFPPDAKKKACPTCEGQGSIRIPPFMARCHACKGMGEIVKEHCMTCRGSGVIEGVKEVKVTIPEGVESGATIHVRKAGNAGSHGIQPGDLYINLKVAKDPIFTKDGADVYVDANISFTQAILGGKVEVPTLSGKTQIKIPKGVQHGQLVVLKGKGFPQHGILVDHGDQYVRIRINFPSGVGERQRAILEEFAEEEITHRSSSSSEDNWWQQTLERASSPDFLLKFSVLMVVLLLLSKVVA